MSGPVVVLMLALAGTVGAPVASQGETGLRHDHENVPRALVIDAAVRRLQPPVQPPADPVADEPAPPPGPPPAVASRVHMANHYLWVDALFMPLIGDGPRRVGPEKIAEFNREFDAATIQFFASNYPGAIARFDELGQRMQTTEGGEIPPSIGAPIVASVDPPVWWPGSPATPRVRLGSCLPVEAEGKVTVELTWTDGRASPQGRPRTEKEIVLKKGEAFALEVALEEFGPWPGGGEHWAVGTYFVEARVLGRREWSRARYCVVPGSLDESRKAHEERLNAARTAHPALGDVITLCRVRNRLLTDYPGTVDPAEFMADFPALGAELEGEVAAIEEGRNPYARRVGEVYRPIVGKGTPDSKPVPCVVYAPSVAADDTLRPLVIALHGAGGDASMFIRGFGAGRLTQLAEDKGFVVASVQSYKLAGRGEVFDLLLAQLERDYAIDRSRVYVIGHSMGAGVATYFAGARPRAVAGAVCFAGLGRPGLRTAPILAYTGGLDAIARSNQIRAALDEARSKNLPLELREAEHYGHTLLVNARLDEAVEWLLGKSLAPPPAP